MLSKIKVHYSGSLCRPEMWLELQIKAKSSQSAAVFSSSLSWWPKTFILYELRIGVLIWKKKTFANGFCQLYSKRITVLQWCCWLASPKKPRHGCLDVFTGMDIIPTIWPIFKLTLVFSEAKMFVRRIYVAWQRFRQNMCFYSHCL